jgi:LemA protein
VTIGTVVVIVLILVVAGLAIGAVGAYNSLIRLRNLVQEAWRQIDVELTRRHDLIGNLVETVKGYAAHEQSTFQKVTEARAAAINAQTVGEQGKAENMLSGALKSLFAVAEAYPELKANQNFMQLQEELTGTEGKVAFARQFYNDMVMQLNTAIQRFPGNIVAGIFHVTEREYFEIGEEEARGPVKVQF